MRCVIVPTVWMLVLFKILPIPYFSPFTTCESLAFLEDLGRIFLYFMIILFSRPHPCPSILLSRLVLGPSPIGIVSACFWSYLSTRKQSILHIIEGGMGGKPTGVMFCLLWGFFSNPSSSFVRCIYAISSGFSWSE